MNLTLVPDRAGFLNLAQSANLIPVYAEVLADMVTPLSAYLTLSGAGHSFLLESVEQGERFSRYSFVGFEPSLQFRCKNGRVRILETGQDREYAAAADPLAELQAIMARYTVATTVPGLPLFYGGAVGYLAYEAVRHFEPTVPAAKSDDLGVPDACFDITDSILIFDHLTRRLKVVACVHVQDAPARAYDHAVQRIGAILDRLRQPASLPHLFPCLPVEPADRSVNMTHEDYVAMTSRMQEYIRAGDIFQVVPSQRFTVPCPNDPVALYRALRSINPSPYMFLLRFDDHAVVGSSPEVHVRLSGDKVEVRPIAGTRPRCEDPAADLAMERELLADAKERAEHVMLVDLARNDVGRVCEFHTVKVPEFMAIERYSHVMHIVSHVEGRLRPGRNAYDVMRATFPAGTVSGSPKVRAMQIIAEQEPTCRGTYAGAVGYFGFSGNLDSCIAIRTLLLKDGKAHLQAGGGLVADSTPEGEYQESLSKAKAGMRALALAHAHRAQT